jgi:hypothetical protein
MLTRNTNKPKLRRGLAKLSNGLIDEIQEFYTAKQQLSRHDLS